MDFHLAESYLTIDSAYCPRLLRKKEKILFLSKKSGTPQVWQRFEDGSIEQITYLKENIKDIVPSPSGEKIILIVDFEGNELLHLYLFNLRNRKVTNLVPLSNHLYYFGGWSPCEEKIIWSSNKRNTNHFDLYIQYITTKKYKMVLPYSGVFQPMEWLPDGRQVIINSEKTNIDSSLFIMDLETGLVNSLINIKKTARFQWLQSFQNGEKGYFLADYEGDFLSLYEICLKTYDFKRVIHEKEYDIEQLILSPDEKKMVYVINKNGQHELNFWDQINNDSYIIDTEMGIISDISWVTNEQIIFNFTNPTKPSNIWSYFFITNTLKQLTTLGEIDKLLLKEPKLLSFTSFDNLKVPYFYYDREESKSPIIIYVHEGPESQFVAEFNNLFQFLNNVGFAIAAPNIRGSMGYGRAYSKLDDKENRLDALKDVIELVNVLDKSGEIDLKNIIIMGHSYGGFITNLALTHYPEIWSAGISMMGISHLKTFFETIGEWRKPLREYEYGSLETYGEFFHEIAPLHRVQNIQAPLMFVHGRHDMQVPYNETIQFIKGMKAHQKEFSFLQLTDEGHYLRKKENFISVNNKIIKFIEKVMINNSK